jgi:hypothetical protein
LAVNAKGYIRKMRGGAQGFLLFCDDGSCYVVKFQNNPQHIRILANEWLATKIAVCLELAVPACEVVHADEAFIAQTNELVIQHPGRTEACRPGLHFGSRLAGGIMPGVLTDYLPETRLAAVTNLQEFAGCLVFDKWLCNADGRQAVFTQQTIHGRTKHYRASFIDQGFCFNGDWKLKDAPLRGSYARNAVYRGITSWDSFEPWISAIEEFPIDDIWKIALSIPSEWYGGQRDELQQLVEQLARRRALVRELIRDFRTSSRNPFPDWS